MRKLHRVRYVIVGPTYGMGFNFSIQFLVVMWDQLGCCMNIIFNLFHLFIKLVFYLVVGVRFIFLLLAFNIDFYYHWDECNPN